MDKKLKQLIEFIHAEQAKAISDRDDSALNNDEFKHAVNMGRSCMCQDILIEAERIIFQDSIN